MYQSLSVSAPAVRTNLERVACRAIGEVPDLD